MTENRKLKARVRDRMARTGESYTTAHRHVVSDRSTAGIPGVVAGYEGFDDHTHRPSALASRMLTQAGCDVSETTACGLGGGIGFLYAVFEYKQLDHPLLTIVAQHHPAPWLETAAGHLGVTTLTQHSSASRAAVGKLEKVLADGKPAQVLVAKGELPWHPAGSPMEAADPYAVVVAGTRDGSFLVDDVPGGPRLVDGDVLGRAWAAHRKGRHEMTTVAEVPDRPDLARAVRQAVALTADHLTGPVLGNAFDVNFGLSGMARLAKDLRDTRTRSGWTARFSDEPGFRYVTARLAECLTSAYTAPGGTRPLYSAFLSEASALLDSPETAGAAEEIAASGRQWQALADLASTASESPLPDRPDEVFAELAEHVDAAAAHEGRAVEALRQALSR